MKTDLTISFFLVVLFLMGCSKNNELSRDKATSSIKQTYHFPGVEVRNLNLGYENEVFTLEKYDKLESKGLITTSRYFGWTTGNINSSELTNKGKEYAVGSITHDNMSGNNIIQVRVASIEFGEITGIVERKELNVAEVNYTVIRKDITPFGKIFNINEGTENKSVTFTKYDDGWRINQ